MKRILVLTAIVLIVAASSVVAGEPPHPGHPSLEGAELGHYLNLSTDQRAVWDSAHQEFETTAGPLIQKHREMSQQLEAALKSSSVDACAIGNQMIAAQAIVKQIVAAKDALTQKQLSVLTPDQRTKYDAFIAARGADGPMMMKQRIHE